MRRIFIAGGETQARSFQGKAIWICFALQLCFLILIASPQKAWAVSPPTFTPSTGLYFPGPTVTMSATSGATIYFTTDGTLPNLNSQVYSTGITKLTPTVLIRTKIPGLMLREMIFMQFERTRLVVGAMFPTLCLSREK
jgi:hypothetical protein